MKEVYAIAVCHCKEKLRDFACIRPQPPPEEVGIYIGKVLKQFVLDGFSGNAAWQIPIQLIAAQQSAPAE
ncbi:hypothetical protein [Gimesia sp.]|uniref:hypothetical protein n=1 Tax=Gimesia sp. TaxID=2024833 RepID=UPI003A8CE966